VYITLLTGIFINAGVMSARAIIENPAMFAGFDKTPVECMEKWIDINERLWSLNLIDYHFTMFHRHLIHMCSPLLTKPERKVFNNLTNKEDVLDYIGKKFGLEQFISSV
jgi:tRNA-dihydrouridine synthase 4